MKSQRIQVPVLSIRASVSPGTINLENRTVEMVWSTGASVLRGGFLQETFFEELSMDPDSIRLERLNGGAPLLNSHEQQTLEDIIGVVEQAWVSDGEGKAVVRFSNRDDVTPIFNDVANGIIRNVSVGYRVYKYEDVTPPTVPGQEPPTRIYRAVDWEPFELSMVPIGADSRAGVRYLENEPNDAFLVSTSAGSRRNKEVPTMEENQSLSAPPDAQKEFSPPDVEQIRKAAAIDERERVLEIRRAIQAAKLEEGLAERLINDGTALDKARAVIIDELAKKDSFETRNHVVVTRDEGSTHIEAMTEAIAHRANPNRNKLTDKGRDFVGMSMLELVREHLAFKGEKTKGLSRMQLAGRAFHGTSDFPAILENVINKTLRMEYEGSPRTFTTWCRQATAPDFKTISRTQLSDYPSFDKLNENGEFKWGKMSDGKETYALATYGKIIGVTRQSLINDDLSAFDRIPTKIARAAADLESDTVYGIVTSNPNLADGFAIFQAANHKNYTSSGTVISVASLGIGRAALRSQTNLQGRPINLRPQYLIVPVALETVAQQFTSQAYVAQQSSNINPFANNLIVVPEPRLDAASVTAWYLSAEPAMIDTIEYCYLEGQQGVYTETELGFEVDGMKIKARHDFAAKAIDFRGLYKNAGA